MQTKCPACGAPLRPYDPREIDLIICRCDAVLEIVAGRPPRAMTPDELAAFRFAAKLAAL
jgi:hypothetical protein